jgi:peptidoglycan/xylan/chitin deacetylase (PgdA/CDA1 family)
LDWVVERSSRNYLTSTQITERILSFGDGGDGLNGGIVLMHLCTRREDPGATRLGELIDALRRDGYRLVTVTELQRDLPPCPPVTAALTNAGD